MNGQNRTDRILIGIALIIFLMAGSAFYFDNWMWGNRRDRSERIGLIDTKRGDVRMKFEGDLKWSRAARGQELNYNDSIFAGAGSQADLKLGQTQMTVTENTLIVLRRDKDVNFLNLNYGTLLGRVAKNEKVVIDTGSGKPIELTTTNSAQIVLRKQNGRTQLDVISGEANLVVNGKMRKVTKDSRIVVDDKAPDSKVEQVKLKALKPLKEQTIYSEEPTDIAFQWEWSSGRTAQAGEKFTLEFASEPAFRKIHTTKVVQGRLDSSMKVSRTLSLFYRVRGPRSELSQTEKVNFVRLTKPVIVRPVANQKIITPPGQNALVEIEFNRPENTEVWYQLAADPEFKQIMVNQSIPETRKISELAIGSYYIRARGNYGSDHLTGWSETVPFKVEAQLETLRLAELAPNNRILIPNHAYPPSLYSASPNKVREFLKTKGFLADYFPFAKGTFEQLKVQFDGDSAPVVQTTPQWPEKNLKPGQYRYRYQISKLGFQDSPVSDPKNLEIAMEPPRPVGEPIYGNFNDKNLREAQINFTPLLFAKSYDVEVARNPYFTGAQQLKVDQPQAKALIASQDHYWRARARDAQGRIISDFSKPYKMTPPAAPAPIMLTKNEPIAREPQQAVEKTTTRIEKVKEENWHSSGWWAWVGTGFNYIDYGQSTPRGTATSHGGESGSKYFEVGFNGNKGWGGVFGYKDTPGRMSGNLPVDNPKFNWSTISVEALMRRLSSIRLFNSPVAYGVRVGVQQHRTPFMSLNSDADSLVMTTNEMRTASVGVLAEWMRHRWTHYWLMRYQVPFSSQATGSSQFSITPTFAFDGSLGSSYNVTERFKAGLFWYGQWHQYNFVYSDSDVTNSGFQSLFYSNIDFRLGFDF